MTADFTVSELYEEEDGNIVAKAHDVVYDEDFDKYLGNPDEESGKNNAIFLLKDSKFNLTDEVQKNLMEIFRLEEAEAEEDELEPVEDESEFEEEPDEELGEEENEE